MSILSNFSDRLNEQMILRSLNAPALAEKVGVSRATIAGFLRGAHLPSRKIFFALLEFFNCSADYLLGFDDFPPTNVIYVKPVEKFGIRFRKLLTEFNCSQYKLEKDLDISGNLVYKWLHDLTQPNVESFIKLANYFDVSVDFIIGRST